MTNHNRHRVAVCHPHLNWGGSESRALWTIQGLKDDYDVTLVTGGRVNLEALNAFYGTSLKTFGFAIRQAPLPLWVAFLRKAGVGDALKDLPYHRFCKKIAGKFDLLISTYNFCHFGLPGIHFIADFSWDDEIRRQFDSKRGLLGRIIYHDNLLRRGYLRMCRRIDSPAKNDFLNIDDVIIANSKWSARIMKQKYGYQSETIYPPVAENFQIVPWENKKCEFVCIGRIDPAKRLERIIEILDLVRAKEHDVKLNIAGAIGKDAYGRKIKRLAELRADWIFLHGRVWGEAKETLLTSCKYGIQAREAEPFGISVAEMVKAGCIPFVPKEGGQAEIVNHPMLMYANINEAVDKIVAVLEKPQLQAELCEHLEIQGRQFSTERFMAGLRNIVQQVLARRYCS